MAEPLDLATIKRNGYPCSSREFWDLVDRAEAAEAEVRAEQENSRTWRERYIKADAEVRALREQLDKRDEELAAALVVIAAARMTTEDFAVITKTYTGREVAAVYRSVLRTATADPTPDPETDR